MMNCSITMFVRNAFIKNKNSIVIFVDYALGQNSKNFIRNARGKRLMDVLLAKNQ